MKRADFLIGGAVFLAALAAYLHMLCPTVYWEDSGELIASAHSLGIAHPPGHPLWVMLARLFSLPPLGGTPFRVNLLSALCASLTVAVIYFALLTLLNSLGLQRRSSVLQSSSPVIPRVSAISASLALAFSGTFWFYSEISEVYALLGLFSSGLLLLTLLWRGERRPMMLIAFWYLYGLALTNNVILLALLPAFLYFLIAHRTIQPFNYPTIQPSNHRTIQPSHYAMMVLAFLLGLSLYLYLPIRSRFNPFVDWGNPQNLSNLAAVLSAKEFTPQFLSLTLSAPGGPLRGIWDYFAQLPRQFGYLASATGVLGGFALFRGERKLLLFLIAGILLSVGFGVFAGGGPDLPAYFIPSYVFFSTLIGVGAWELLRRLRRTVAYVLLPLSILVPLLTLHFGVNNRRGDWGAWTYGRDLAETISDGVLFTENTVDCFLIWYFQEVEDAPARLAIYTPLLKEGWYREKLRLSGLGLPEGGSLTDVALRVSESFPAYYTPSERFLIDPEHLSPWGVVFRIGGGVDMETHSSLLKRFGYPGSSSNTVKKHYSLVHSHLGEYFYRRGMVGEAVTEYSKAAQIDEENPRIFQNLGVLYEEKGSLDSARTSYEKAVQLGSREPSPYLNLGVMALKSGDLSVAVSWLRSSLSMGKTSRAHYHLGICYLRLRDIERAIGETRRAISLDPDFPDAHNNLGVCYYQLGDYEKAAEQFRRALELNPDYSQAKYNLELLKKKIRKLDKRY